MKNETVCTLSPIIYPDAAVRTDMDVFYAETKKPDGLSHDGRLNEGFVRSVWHRMTVNGVDVPVYSARCGKGIHSFAWLDAETDADSLELCVTVELLTGDMRSAVVLPESSKVTADVKDGKVSFVVRAFGNYSLIPDGKPGHAVTLMIAPAIPLTVPDGWKTVRMTPGRLSKAETAFTEENTAVIFPAGTYEVASIALTSHTLLYFERGAYVKVYLDGKGDTSHAICTYGAKDVTITGRALFDFSDIDGSSAGGTKGVCYDFVRTDGLTVEGLTTVNSHSWTLCMTLSRNADISRCMFFGYRTFSDGVMFTNCRDSYAHDCFVRTGDDGMEVKANASEGQTENTVLFEHNTVWTDKGIGYGVIFEANHDVSGVVFRGNSVGFAQADWSEHLGCCTVQMGSNKKTTFSDIHFENIEVYHTDCALCSVYDRATDETSGGKIDRIFFDNITARHASDSAPALRVTMRLWNGAPAENCSVGNLYLDNISFRGLPLTDRTAPQIVVNCDPGTSFERNRIFINTRNSADGSSDTII